MICIYHSKDLDGWMSAAIVKLKYPDVKLIGWSYGDPPVETAVNETFNEVVMVDISFPPDVMLAVARLDSLIWIDHHDRTIKETIKYFDDHSTPPPMGPRDPKFAACELTWMYLFPNQKMPELVRLLGRYDCFGHKGTAEEKKVLEFQYGSRAFISNPEEALKYLNEYLISEYNAQALISNIHYAGESIYKYLQIEAKQKYNQKFTISFAEWNFACVNTERLNPINFGIDYHKDGYDGFACFWYENGKWIFSLYNDDGKVDCSAIAKQFGGGGHKGASGFQVKDLNSILIYKN
jgi:uncharacterized protein